MFLKNKPAPETFMKADTVGRDTSGSLAASKSQKKQNALLSVCSTGIHVRSGKSSSNEDRGESTGFDVQMDFSEIHVLRESGTSMLEILKLTVVSAVYVPIQPAVALRAEIDVKLGGTQCNIIMNRLKPWMSLHLSKKKKMVLREESSSLERSKTSEFIAIMWTCTVSAPEMTVVLYSINGLPLYHGCSQSSHVFPNNISSTETAVHMELGELHFHMSDEYQECLKESLFGVETNTGSLMHISRIPNASISNNASDAKVQVTTTWEWVIQGLDVHICLPFRLQLRAIEDAVEEMLRGLKLISAAKTSLIFPKKDTLKTKKPSSSSKFGCVKFCIRKLTADIEEEPLQGWLDEHYQLMKNEACELAVRLKFLDDLISEGIGCSRTAEPKESCSKRKVHYNGFDIDLHDSSVVQKLQEEIHKQAFQSYYQRC